MRCLRFTRVNPATSAEGSLNIQKPTLFQWARVVYQNVSPGACAVGGGANCRRPCCPDPVHAARIIFAAHREPVSLFQR
jgi:hypothetical protein